MFSKQSVELTSDGRRVKIHLVSTGMVAVKTRFRETRFKGLLSTPDFIFDPCFTEWMPVWVMIIEHPEVIFVIDTGEISAVTQRGYFRSSGLFTSWFDTSQFRFRVNREEEI